MKYSAGMFNHSEYSNASRGFTQGGYTPLPPKPQFVVTKEEVKDVQASAGRVKNWAHWYAVYMTFNHHPSRSVAWWEDAFKRAQVAHHEFEKTLGHIDAEWASWYAEFLTKASAN